MAKIPVHDENGRVCAVCNEYKLWSCFHISKSGFNGFQARCSACRSKSRDGASLFLRFGITETDYEALEEKQGGLCLICKESCSRGFRLSIDHDHKTGRIRGLLCNACNIGLGSFRDNPDLLRRAAEYLE